MVPEPRAVADTVELVVGDSFAGAVPAAVAFYAAIALYATVALPVTVAATMGVPTCRIWVLVDERGRHQ